MKERGSAVVEFAMVALLFFTLLIAVLEGGRIFFLQAQLGSAAREAAREMAISGDQGVAQGRADAAFPLVSPTWDATNSTPCPTPVGDDDNAVVSLYVETQMITKLWPNTFTLRGTGVMRCNG